jgi:hypothetical protein
MSGRLANVAVAKSEHGASPLPHQHHCCSFTWETAKLKCRSLAWGAAKSVWYKKSFSAKIKNSFKKVLKNSPNMCVQRKPEEEFNLRWR